jgi:probable biosynthetic protein (TIGR04098 family)
VSLAFDTAEILSSSSVARRTTMSLPTCGPGSLFFGQVGEWTWQTVSALCGDPGFSVHTARTPGDVPTYLSFYYYRLLGSPSMHHTLLAVGDELDISSRSLNCGSESVLTLHRIARSRPCPRPAAQPHDGSACCPASVRRSRDPRRQRGQAAGRRARAR